MNWGNEWRWYVNFKRFSLISQFCDPFRADWWAMAHFLVGLNAQYLTKRWVTLYLFLQFPFSWLLIDCVSPSKKKWRRANGKSSQVFWVLCLLVVPQLQPDLPSHQIQQQKSIASSQAFGMKEGEGRKNGTVRRVAQYAGLYVLVVLCWPLCLSGCDSIWFAVAILPILGQIVWRVL